MIDKWLSYIFLLIVPEQVLASFVVLCLRFSLLCFSLTQMENNIALS